MSNLQAEPASTLETTTDLFTSGRWELSLSSGALFSPFGEPDGRPTINYTLTGLQLGYMLSDWREAGIFSGNFEVCAEGFGSSVFAGPGNYIAGFTLWGRYNFVPRDWRLIPYIQGGAGMAWTDIDRGITGQDFNFNLDLGAGVRFLLSKQWSVNFEYRYQHISNADLGAHNLGINSNGALLSVSFLF